MKDQNKVVRTIRATIHKAISTFKKLRINANSTNRTFHEVKNRARTSYANAVFGHSSLSGQSGRELSHQNVGARTTAAGIFPVNSPAPFLEKDFDEICHHDVLLARTVSVARYTA